MVQLWPLPHHDGSERYVPVQTPRLGEELPVFLRVPRASDVTSGWVRVIRDGEPELVAAEVDRVDESDTWLRADVRAYNPVVSYRWLLDGGQHGYQWLNQAGLHQHDVADAHDFRLTTFDKPPSWASSTIYQIFPDRFAKSAERPVPDWALPAQWDDPVIGEGPDALRQYYGGDLDGIIAQLDHIESLGVGTVYLTPVFPAPSNHRYNASTFSRIDPLLGGDAAFARLADALHARGMRLMGDLTANHCGDTHEWFQAALADPDSPEAGFFFFTHHPDAYDSWWDIDEMPILNHTSPELRRRLYEGPDSVVAQWMRSGLDAWRIDVANMAGRHGEIDLAQEVGRRMRSTMRAVNPDHFLQMESNHDASADVLGDGYQGSMSYAAFTRPVLQWLQAPQPLPLKHGKYPMMPNLPGPLAVAAMRALSGVTPWVSTLHAMNLIGSHDTHRVATLLGGVGTTDVAYGLLATYPGVPMIYAGDELGLAALGPEYARIPIPWDLPERWDEHRLAQVRTLFAMRAEHPALRFGGLRWVSVNDDSITFLREHPRESILVHAARAPHEPLALPESLLGASLTGLAGTPDVVAADGWIILPSAGPAFGVWLL